MVENDANDQEPTESVVAGTGFSTVNFTTLMHPNSAFLMLQSQISRSALRRQAVLLKDPMHEKLNCNGAATDGADHEKYADRS